MAHSSPDFESLCRILNASEQDISSLVSEWDQEQWVDPLGPPDEVVHGTWSDETTESFHAWMEAGMPEYHESVEEELISRLPFDGYLLWEMQETLLRIAERLQRAQKRVYLPKDVQRRLTDIANYPVPRHVMASKTRGPVRVALVTTPFCEFIVGAVRALWVVLAGDAELLRCPAPAPRPKNAPHNFSESCGRWFVSGGGEGRPRKYCSDTCAKRASRRGVVRSSTESLKAGT